MASVKNFAKIDATAGPTVVIDLFAAPKTDAEIDGFFARFKSILKIAIHGSKLREDGTRRVQPGKIFLLFKLDGLMSASISQQMRAGGFIREIKPLVPDAIYCTALVVTGFAARSVLKFILAMAPLSSTYSVFESEDEAAVWIVANRTRVADGQPCVTNPFAEMTEAQIAELTKVTAAVSGPQ